MIGSNGKEYHVHGTAISRLSKPLAVLINGDMREAKEKRVQWPEIDEQTFVRFTQWAYTKTYVAQEPNILLDSSLIQTPPEGKSSEVPLYSLVTAICPNLGGKIAAGTKTAPGTAKTTPTTTTGRHASLVGEYTPQMLAQVATPSTQTAQRVGH